MLKTIMKCARKKSLATLLAGAITLSSLLSCEKSTEPPEPTIVGTNGLIGYTYVPPKGSFKNLEGVVMEVNPSEYRVSVYINVRGTWWMKPYWSTPLTTIGNDKKWSTDITTGGVDAEATHVNAYLVSPDYEPSYHALPVLEDSKVFDEVSVTR